MNEHFFIYNGKLIGEKTPIIGPSHPGLMHGDGLFETMRMHDGKIMNQPFHEERIRHGCDVLGYRVTEEKIKTFFDDCEAVYTRMPLPHLRIRLSVFRRTSVFNRSDEGEIDYLIQGMPTGEPVFNEEGITAMIYKDSFKDAGLLSNLKHSSYLLNVQAFRAARDNGKDEAIILNRHYRVCETSIANLFFVEGDTLFTPTLSEGCVAGTLRRWLLEHTDKTGFKVVETTCSSARLLSADEVFITNAVRWVVPLRALENQTYRIAYSGFLFEQLKNHLM